MKKIISIFLSLALLVSCFSSINVKASDLFAQDSVTLIGKTISIEDFKKEFELSEGQCSDSSNYQDAILTISKGSLSDKTVDLSFSLFTGSTEVDSFKVSGAFYKGYREQVSSARSLVFNNEDNSSKETDLLLFELVNGASGNNYFVDDQVTVLSAIRVVLQRGDMLYIFESSLPESFENEFYAEHDQISDSTKDFLWFSSFITPEVKEITTVLDSESIARMNSISSIGTLAATSSVRWVNDKTYQTSFNEHGNKWVERSLPFGYYRITDINHSNTTWKAEFYIDESIMINGRKATGYTNLVRYNNVKIGITCGKNSELLSTSITGRVSKSSGAEIANAAFDVLSAVSNWWSTGTAIANVFKAMKDSGKDIKLGGSAYTGFPSGTTSVGIAMQKNEYLFNNSYSSSSSTGVTTNSPAHYIIFQTNACSTSASGTASTYTKGCVTFQWDAFLNSDYTKLDTAKKKSFEVNYYSKY